MDERCKSVERAVEVVLRDAMYFKKRIGPQQPVQRDVPVPDSYFSCLGGETQPFFVLLQRVVSSLASDRECELAADVQAQFYFLARTDVRRVVIEHELADHFSPADQRHEIERLNSFFLNYRAEVVVEIGSGDIADRDWLRVEVVRLPRRVSFNGANVLIRQAARSDEAHHGRFVKQKNRGSVTTQPI